MTAPQKFEDRLLHELRHVVAEGPTPAGTPARRPRRRRLTLAGAGLGVAAAATLAVVLATGGDVSSAYAVESQPNGAVTVSIRSLSDAAGLQAKLRAVGVPAVVDYVPGGPAGCAGPPPGLTPGGGPVQGTASAPAPAPGTAPTGPTKVEGVAMKVSAGGAPESGLSQAPEAGGGPTLSPGGPLPGDAGVTSSKIAVGPDGASFTIDPGTLEPGQQVYISTSTGAVTSISMMIGTRKGPVPCPPAP